MDSKLRKLFIWTVSLVVVLAIYLLYIRLNKTAPIEIETIKKTLSDSNASQFDKQIGMVTEKVGVGTVENAIFTDLNKKTKEIERKFGFKQLIHKQGDQWEVEGPFMDIFRRDFKCFITADRGQVQAEKAVGSAQPSPKDASLAGNVVIHIVPERKSDTKEGFIYLDDVFYTSEKSQFSTAGPIKYISEDTGATDAKQSDWQSIQMLGKGMELIYNTEQDHLEFLRIIHLEKLLIKTLSKTPLLSSQRPQAKVDSSVAAMEVKTERIAEPVVADFPQEAKVSPKPDEQVISPAVRAADEKKKGQYYKAMLSKNVVIDTPEQLIVADEVFINNIPPSKTSDSKTTKADTRTKNIEGTPSHTPDEGIAPEQSGTDTKSLKAPSVSAVEQVEPNKPAKQTVDIVVTCDDGIVVTPMDSKATPADSGKVEPKTSLTDDQIAKILNDANGRPTFVAQRIDYCAITNNTVAPGRSELSFYTGDVLSAEPNKANIPIKITAQKGTEFLAAQNRVIFEGDCVGTMLRKDPNNRQKYTLSAPKLTIDLAKDKTERPSALTSGIEHLTADGGIVKLASIKTAKELQNQTPEKPLGGAELKCYKFDYDANQQLFLVTGPGIITVDNSEVQGPNTETSRFSLQKPCWAFVRDFEVLKYFLQTNKIVAYNNSQRMFIDYFPIVKDKSEQHVKATCSNVEINLVKTASGGSEVSTLLATGGITYEDADKQFAGSELFYDANESTMIIKGNDVQPCLLNGAPVDGIEYNLKTGKLKFNIVGPGSLKMKR